MKFKIKNTSYKDIATIVGSNFEEALKKYLSDGGSLSGAYLARAEIRDMDLSGVDLSGADLTSADLTYSNLHKANLAGANLTWASMNHTNLSDANLKGANLTNTDFERANLTGANLIGATLTGANLAYSALPLWCGSFSMIVDDRIVAQLFSHWARLDVSRCSAFVRYVHRVTCTMFGGYMANLYCEFKKEVSKVQLDEEK